MESIAVIGLGCRFPGAGGPQAFWTLLWNGVDAVTEVPAERWERARYYDPEPGRPGKMVTCCAGFLDEIDGFDHEFFGIDAREVRRLDPQQRLMLEVAWEAIEDAGIDPGRLAGTQTGVFLGVRQTDFNRYLYGDLARIDGRNPDSTYPCIIANRISYLLDLRGPSLAVDTACSSSLVSVHMACQSLHTGECDLALAGGVNLNLYPEELISRSLAGMISPSGRCRAFDAKADGYVFGEGCGAVVLKRLHEAQRDEDNILAVIRGSATNHNGLSYKLTAYNGLSQQALLKRALDDAGVAAQDVGMIEANGTGSYLGDPIELKALRSVYGDGVAADAPRCWIGSVKTNLGHLEGAAGIASLIKAVLALQHQGVPPHLHLREINPQASLDGTRLAIAVAPQPWPRGARRRVAAVSAFGLGGANAHMILEEAPAPAPRPDRPDRPEHVLTLSAQSESALRALAARYREHLQQHTDLPIADLCFTANTGRALFRHRLAVFGGSVDALRDALDACARAGPLPERAASGKAGRKPPKVAFVFPAAPEPWPAGAGRVLYRTQPEFRQAVERCEEILRPQLRQSLVRLLVDELAPEVDLETTAQADFALQYAWARVWQAWGIAPAAAIGAGVGGVVAACVAGACTLEQALASMRAPMAHDAAESTLADGIARAVQEGCTFFLQLGPGSIALPDGVAAGTLTWLTSSQPDWFALLRGLAELHVRGVAVDWAAFDRGYARRRVQAPTYAFQRQCFPLERIDSGGEAQSAAGDGIDQLIGELLDDSDVEQLAQLWGEAANPSAGEALRRQVRSLGVAQAADLLARAVQLSREKDRLLQEGNDRAALRRRVAGLDAAQTRELLVKSIELLWKKDELLNAYLDRRFAHPGAQAQDLEQTRAGLVYMSELLRRKNLRLSTDDGG
jgi:acyl transferase domain-containing protein